MNRQQQINFDLLIMLCDISACDLNYERNTETYGMTIIVKGLLHGMGN